MTCDIFALCTSKATIINVIPNNISPKLTLILKMALKIRKKPPNIIKSVISNFLINFVVMIVITIRMYSTIINKKDNILIITVITII